MTDQPTLFPVGKETLSWLRQGGRMANVPWRISLQMRWRSYWFEHNLSLQRKLHLEKWQGDDPLFVLGLWRSGTTYMHELLTECPGLVSPTTWQCMNPSTLRITSPPRVVKSLARPMDNFTVNTFSPQEDEFALLALGVPSVYRSFFDPGRLNDVVPWLDPDFWLERSDGWIEIWREFLGGVVADQGGRLLLKSPNHTFRVRALVNEFPRSSFVWLVRDPVETLFSNRKMWVAMFRRYALHEWNEAKLNEFLARAFQYAADSLAYATSVLGKDRLVVVDFHRFIQAPVATIEAVNQRIHIGDGRLLKESLNKSVTNRVMHGGEAYCGDLVSPELMTFLENLDSIQRRSLDSHGL